MADPADNKGDDRAAESSDNQTAIGTRLSKLGEKLKRAKARHSGSQNAQKRSSALGMAYRLTVELVVGLVVGGFIGWWLDYFLGTSPAFLLIFFVLGMAAGILNVIKTAKELQANQIEQGVAGGKPVPSYDDEDDD